MFLKKKLNKRILITRQIEPSSQIANQHQHFDSLRTTFHRNSQTISKMLALQKKKKKKKKNSQIESKKKKKNILVNLRIVSVADAMPSATKSSLSYDSQVQRAFGATHGL